MEENDVTSKTLKINSSYLLVGILSIILLVLVWGIYSFLPKSKVTSSKQTNDSLPTKSPGDPGTYALPLPFTHPNVANGKFYYTVGGNVKIISQNRIILTSKDPKNEIPQFPLTKQTVITFGDNTPATISDIIVGKFVYVSANYDLSTRSWTTTNITTYK